MTINFDEPIYSQDKQESGANLLSTLVEFVFAMKEKLKEINDHSYNNFALRVGTKCKILFS